MSNPVPVYDVFGYMHGEKEHLDCRRPGIPEWRLDDIVRYFTTRGYDGILIERRKESVTFDPPAHTGLWPPGFQGERP